MKFSQTRGNDDVRRALAGMVDSGRVPHAIMLHEDNGGGAFRLASAFLQYLFCRNGADGDSCGACPSCNKVSKMISPDIHYIFPVNAGMTSDNYLKEFREMALSNPDFTEEDLDGSLGIEGKNSMIAVAQASEIIRILSLSALEGGYRAVVVYLPEKMNQVAANSLLKLVEEPPEMTVFVFITHAPEKVLVTISSRCQNIRVKPDPGSGTVWNDEYFSLLEEMMGALIAKDLPSLLGTADRMSSLPSRESAKAFCKFAAGQLRKVFLLQQGMDSLAGETHPSVRVWAGSCRKPFVRCALECLGRAVMLIDRNVNMKILFSDLSCRLYKTI